MVARNTAMNWCDNYDQCHDAEPVFDLEFLLVLAKGGDGAGAWEDCWSDTGTT